MPVSLTNGIRIEGLDEMQQTLNEVVPNVAFNLMRAVTLGVAQEVAKRARERAPRDFGTLRKAIKAKRGNPRHNKGKPYADVVVEHGKNVKNDAFYWRFLEHGTKPHGDHPGIQETRFMSRSIDSVRPEIPAILEEQFRKKFQALLKRQAKKAQKRAKR